MSVLLIDFETTSLDTKTARILEIACQVTNDDFTKVEDQFESLVWESGYPALTQEIKDLTHIDEEMLLSGAITPEVMWYKFSNLVTLTEGEILSMAYNSEYDRNILISEVGRGHYQSYSGVDRIFRGQWACAMQDLEPNYQKKCWKLSHLALDYGIPVDPTKLHRAMADVELTRQVLIAAGATRESILQFRDDPWIYVEAAVRKPWEDGGKSSTYAKSLGYSWEIARGCPTKTQWPKKWVKRIKQSWFEKENANLNLKIKAL